MTHDYLYNNNGGIFPPAVPLDYAGSLASGFAKYLYVTDSNEAWVTHVDLPSAAGLIVNLSIANSTDFKITIDGNLWEFVSTTDSSSQKNLVSKSTNLNSFPVLPFFRSLKIESRKHTAFTNDQLVRADYFITR